MSIKNKSMKKLICKIFGHYYPEKYNWLYTSEALWKCSICGNEMYLDMYKVNQDKK